MVLFSTGVRKREAAGGELLFTKYPNTKYRTTLVVLFGLLLLPVGLWLTIDPMFTYYYCKEYINVINCYIGWSYELGKY